MRVSIELLSLGSSGYMLFSGSTSSEQSRGNGPVQFLAPSPRRMAKRERPFSQMEIFPYLPEMLSPETKYVADFISHPLNKH